MSRSVFIAAGGTGGHVFPATSLAHCLHESGCKVYLLTDERGQRYAESFPGDTFRIRAATFSLRKPWRIFSFLLTIKKGKTHAQRLMEKIKPFVVVGFGGYPSFPPVLAAHALGIPIVLHEQNRVMGRANRFLGRYAAQIALSDENTKGAEAFQDKTMLTGTPLRQEVIESAKSSYPALSQDKAFHLLVFGGSQGAEMFSDVVPGAVGLLSAEKRRRIRIVHQVRLERAAEVLERYDELNCQPEIATFFPDLPQRIAQAHLIVCRSGASSIAEIKAIGRPAIYIPYPHALDNDQKKNALEITQAGGGWMIEQFECTKERLFELIDRLMDNPQELHDRAQKARALASHGEAELLTELVMSYQSENGNSP